MIVAAVLVLLVIIIYVAAMILQSTKERTLILSKPIKLDGSQYTIPGNNIVSTTNGQEFTYSFWLYLADEYAATGSHKRLLMRGNRDNLSGANPIVYMHKSANKMVIAMTTNFSLASNPPLADLNALHNSIELPNYNTPLHMVINYIPLQRWVHIAIAFQEGILTVYMDGAIYQVKNMYDISNPEGIHPIGRGTTGDIIVGDSNNRTKGFMTRIEFFNYFLPQKDVMDVYQRGPTGGSFLNSLFGINDYGFRTPVYRKTVEDTVN